MTSTRHHNIYMDGSVCFWTSSIVGRCQVLQSPTAARMLLQLLDKCRREYGVKIVGYVLMPDHIHLAIWAPESATTLRFLKRFLSLSSAEIAKLTDAAATRGNAAALRWSTVFHAGTSGKVRVWKERGRAFAVTELHTLLQKLTYIHNNPVRMNLVQEAEAWEFSSARWYACGTGLLEIDELEW